MIPTTCSRGCCRASNMVPTSRTRCDPEPGSPTMPTDREEVTTWSCPKCGARLERSGTVTMDGVPCPVFVCEADSCQGVWNFGGELFPVAYTFAIDPDGRPFAPGDEWQEG